MLTLFGAAGYSWVMSGDSKDPYEAALADLRAKRAEIDAAIAVIERVRSMNGVVPQGPPPQALPIASGSLLKSVQSDVNPGDMQVRSPFYGLGLREAAPKQLAIVGEPQLPREIWDALSATGFQTAHGDPVGAVHSALRRRAKTHNDVLMVGGGKWGRKDWYTEAQLDEIQKSVGGMGGRDRAAHSERTVMGMKLARQRGAKPGQPTKLTDDVRDAIERGIANGERIPHIAEKLGLAESTIRKWYKGEELTKLKKLRAARPDNGSGLN